MPLRLQRQEGLFMYLCCGKYGMQQAVKIGLSSRVMCRVLVFSSRMRIRFRFTRRAYGSYGSRHARRENSNSSPLLHTLLYVKLKWNKLFLFANLLFSSQQNHWVKIIVLTSIVFPNFFFHTRLNSERIKRLTGRVFVKHPCYVTKQ